METSIALQPGRWMVDVIPPRSYFIERLSLIAPLTILFLVMYVPAWVPGAGFKRWAKTATKTFRQLIEEPFYRVKRDLVGCCFDCSGYIGLLFHGVGRR